MLLRLVLIVGLGFATPCSAGIIYVNAAASGANNGCDLPSAVLDNRMHRA